MDELHTKWDGAAAMRTCKSASDFRAIAFERDNDSDPDTAAHWALPHHPRPGAGADAGGVSAALGALSGARGGAPDLKNAGAARSHLQAHSSALSKFALVKHALEVVDMKTTGDRGEASFLASRWGPDSALAWGHDKQQFMEQGAFKTWIDSGPFPMPFYLDHGDAPFLGVAQASKLIGITRGASETGDGLVIHTSYNMRKQIGADAWSDVKFALENEASELIQISYGWDPSRDVVTDADDEFEHVTETWPVEFSQVVEGAGNATQLLAAASMGERSWLTRIASENARWLLRDEEFKQAFAAQLLADKAFAEDVLASAKSALDETPTPDEPTIENDEIDEIASKMLAAAFGSGS
jgi:hypothetical protein